MRWKPRPKPAASEAGRSGAGDDGSRTAGWRQLRPCARPASPGRLGCKAAGRRLADEQALRGRTVVRGTVALGGVPAAVEGHVAGGTGNRWRRSSAGAAGTEGREPGLARPGPRAPWRTRYGTVSMNWTGTLGAAALCLRTSRVSTSTCRPCATMYSRLPAGRRSASPALLRPPSARGGQAERSVRGHGGHAAALAQADAARAHGGLSTCHRGQNSRRGQTPEQMLNIVCDRLCGVAGGELGIQARRMLAADVPPGCCGGSIRARDAWPSTEDRGASTAGAPTRTSRGRRDRTGERAGFQPARCSLTSHAPTRARHPGISTAYYRTIVLITDRLRMPPGTGAPNRRDPQGDTDQHAVRPDAGRHPCFVTMVRPPGCPGIGSEPPGERRPWARRWRRSRRSKDVHGPLPDRQRTSSTGARWRSTCAGATRRNWIGAAWTWRT